MLDIDAIEFDAIKQIQFLWWRIEPIAGVNFDRIIHFVTVRMRSGNLPDAAD